MKSGFLVALVLSAVPMIGGCTQEEESSAPEESSEGTTEETTAQPTITERTIIKETTVVMVPAPAPASLPAQAPSPNPEAQQAAGPQPIVPEADLPPEVDFPPEVETLPEVEIPHDGTVDDCARDPVCSSEQARIQSENVAEYKRRQGLP